jgi:hypothetical protein
VKPINLILSIRSGPHSANSSCRGGCHIGSDARAQQQLLLRCRGLLRDGKVNNGHPGRAPLAHLWGESVAMLTVLSFGLVPQSASVRLDPLTLIATKGAQTTNRRPYCPPAQNAGLQTATLALG